MERTSRGGGRVWTNLNESHEMRRNGEKFSWDLKVLKIPRGETNPARFLANKCQCCYYLLFLQGLGPLTTFFIFLLKNTVSQLYLTSSSRSFKIHKEKFGGQVSKLEDYGWFSQLTNSGS